jgi:hypothetical protein
MNVLFRNVHVLDLDAAGGLPPPAATSAHPITRPGRSTPAATC